MEVIWQLVYPYVKVLGNQKKRETIDNKNCPCKDLHF